MVISTCLAFATGLHFSRINDSFGSADKVDTLKGANLVFTYLGDFFTSTQSADMVTNEFSVRLTGDLHEKLASQR